jgi:hypothetical protein
MIKAFTVSILSLFFSSVQIAFINENTEEYLEKAGLLKLTPDICIKRGLSRETRDEWEPYSTLTCRSPTLNFFKILSLISWTVMYTLQTSIVRTFMHWVQIGLNSIRTSVNYGYVYMYNIHYLRIQQQQTLNSLPFRHWQVMASTHYGSGQNTAVWQ